MNSLKQIDFQSLNERMSEEIERVLDYFGIEYKLHGHSYQMKCPIHNGKDENLKIHKVNDFLCWKCYSRHCEDDTSSSILGLIWGILKIDNPEITFIEACDFCMEFLGIDTEELKQRSSTIDRRNFIRMNESKDKEFEKLFTRESFRNKVKIPSSYYVSRGYSKDLLDKYDVGFSVGVAGMKNRVVFPVYDENHEYVIGVVGRALNKHEDKWKNSLNFYSGNTFFNLWYAKDKIRNCGTAILVEGQGDVLRFEQAGIHNSLGVFGDRLTEKQLEILVSLGVMNVILAYDNDEAGNIANEKIKEQVKRYFNAEIARLPENKDVGDLEDSEVRNIFVPILERFS